jgi:hypothetical protein
LEPQWREFLSGYTDGRKEQNATESASPTEDTRGSLGIPAATNEQIIATERRLGISLPRDRKTFYQVTNGWASWIPAIEWSDTCFAEFFARAQESSVNRNETG